MLKIYFDWNCITHSKDKYPYILEICESCKEKFIFPYSNAHIRDLMVNKDLNIEEYERDLYLLGQICGKHFLSFGDGQMKPYFGMPQDFIDDVGFLYNILQNTDIISPEVYQIIKETVRKNIPDNVFKRIQGSDPQNTIDEIESYIDSVLPGKDLISIMGTLPHSLRSLMNTETQFKSVCLALDLFGFRPEKKDKRYMNIDADASHVFYAGHCDVFVSADKKLRDKAKAVYSKYNYQTRVISPKEFEDFIEKELYNEYSIEKIINSIKEYGTPRLEVDGLHYCLLQSPILGLFNACHKIDENWGYSGSTSAWIFRYCFNNTPYLFYTEIEKFCSLWLNMLPQSMKDTFRSEYITPITSGILQDTLKTSFTIDSFDGNLQIKLFSDPFTPIPCPMMEVIASPDFLCNYEKIINIIM